MVADFSCCVLYTLSRGNYVLFFSKSEKYQPKIRHKPNFFFFFVSFRINCYEPKSNPRNSRDILFAVFTTYI